MLIKLLDYTIEKLSMLRYRLKKKNNRDIVILENIELDRSCKIDEAIFVALNARDLLTRKQILLAIPRLSLSIRLIDTVYDNALKSEHMYKKDDDDN